MNVAPGEEEEEEEIGKEGKGQGGHVGQFLHRRG